MEAIVDAPLRPAPRTWGGRRTGAGRKKKADRDRTFVAHRARPVHKKRHPVHVTLRAKNALPSFRTQRVHRILRDILEKQLHRRYRDHFQVVHYSVQSNHLHLIVESGDNRTMRAGVSGLLIAFAKRLNRALQKVTGKVWRDRYHARELTTPSEVRRALVYVLQNVRKHGEGALGAFIDPLTSAARFAGWSVPVSTSDPDPFPPRPPRTWLLGEGWSSRGGGLLSPSERPA
jgi:REP element-mobilizing transposase RayT